MPGLLQRGVQFGHAPATVSSAFSGAAGSLPVSSAIWSRQRDDVSYDLLRKFWCELPTQSRRELLRIDKQALCEQARKNLYCSRCHGLLLECYSQIVMYGKSLQQEFIGGCFPQKATAEVLADNESDNLQDPSAHPWGGLATTKDGMLTLLDCFICANSPEVIHKVFSSARQREHDRELLYPDACGGGGRGWISQGLANYGRVHGARETCALHTSRLSCDTLLDFWSALGDETRSALLHMKEDDFIERLMYRFDSKRFCRDCRRNVLREFKELKELKRLRKELRCNSWFCVADTAIQYEVSEDSVMVDWQHSFTDTSTYHHFEWAIGTAEGKGDILDFEDVGMNGKVEVKGLDLTGFSACFITLRAWKLDGRCTELSVKAHALNGQACVHRRLVVGDGFVTITKGDSIKCFFEHAEEVEEEEDDDSIDKDGIELDGDGSRPQKHAKSPELAREFLLDAATVIFKEQVEKAFREGTARQNSHSLFVSLAIKLLEDCIHVACKEIITLEKQIKLLQEEENEKREEEERRERRRTKEREKKQRRKERLKEKDKDREAKLIQPNPPCIDLPTPNHESLPTTLPHYGDPLSDPSDDKDVPEPNSTDMTDDASAYEPLNPANPRSHLEERERISFLVKQSKSSRRKLPYKRSALPVQSPRPRPAFTNVEKQKPYGPPPFREKLGRLGGDKFRPSHGRILAASDSSPFRINHPAEYRLIDRHHSSAMKSATHIRQVWEPMDARKKHIRSNITAQSKDLTFAKVESSAELSKKAGEIDSNNSNYDPTNNNGCHSVMISSSDSCSSCPSEGDSGTTFSSTLNAETSSTSDSEDATQQSRQTDAVNAVTPQPSGQQYRAYPVGGEERVAGVAEAKAELSEAKERRLGEGNGGGGGGGGAKSFSLFHFGGPLVGAAPRAVEAADVCCSMEGAKVEEYSLFAATNSSGFLFSSFTL